MVENRPISGGATRAQQDAVAAAGEAANGPRGGSGVLRVAALLSLPPNVPLPPPSDPSARPAGLVGPALKTDTVLPSVRERRATLAIDFSPPRRGAARCSAAGGGRRHGAARRGATAATTARCSHWPRKDLCCTLSVQTKDEPSRPPSDPP